MSGLGSRPSEDHTAQHFLQGARTEGEDYCFDPGLHSLQGELGDLWLIFVRESGPDQPVRKENGTHRLISSHVEGNVRN